MKIRIDTAALAERARWKLADLLIRLPMTCWCDLVGWVQSDPEERREVYPLTTAFGNSACQRSADECGWCYCGKLRDEERAAELQREWELQYPADDPSTPAPTDQVEGTQ